MPITKLSRAQLGVPANDPFFDDEAAARMYHGVSRMDPQEAEVLLSMAAFHVAATELTKYGDVIEKALLENFAERTERVKKSLVRNLVSKGKDPRPYVDALEQISKAVGPTSFELSERAKRQWRDPQGQFRVMRTRIEPGIVGDGLPGKQAQKLGIPEATQKGSTKDKVSLSAKDRARFQGDYWQVKNLLKTVQSDIGTAKNSFVVLNYSDGTTEYVDAKEASVKAALDGDKYKSGERLLSVDTYVAAEDMPGVDVLSSVGLPYDGAAGNTMRSLMSYEGGEDEGLKTYADNMTRVMPGDERSNTARSYRRLAATADLLSSITPDSAIKTKLALKAAQWAGYNSTQVERVVGPGARKAAYRYRGIEKAPTPGLQAEINRTLASNKDRAEARRKIIYGTPAVIAGNRILEDFRESPLINYLVKDLPKKELVNLQLQSGAMPPSRGFIIDRNGKVITEAVGYGDDHYLPFNLKNISRLKGGEYVRTRTLGGPTTEDIYAGLISGARSVTVVSRSGIYTVEFDDTFRGSRRYSDKAARMVSRYGMILDAVKNGDVTLDTIPADRMAELEEKARSIYPDEDRDYQNELERLKNKERKNPVMSAKRREEATREFLRDRAAKMSTPDGREMSYEQMVEDASRKELAGYAKLIQERVDDPAQARQLVEAKKGEIRSKYGSPASIVATMQLEPEYEKYMERAEQEYASTQTPLQLDGYGYKFALDAMKEQFPYYIKDISYRELNQAERTGRTDVGYVKPRFNRPAAVMAGYNDVSITGAGKIPADQTNYQNEGVYQYRVSTGRVKEADSGSSPKFGASEVESRSSQDRKKSSGATFEDRLDAINQLRKTLQAKKVTDRDAMIAGVNIAAGAAGAVSAPQFQNAFPYMFKMSDAEFELEFEEDPDGTERKVAEELDRLKSIFNFSREDLAVERKIRNKGVEPQSDWNRDMPNVIDVSSGKVFKFGGVYDNDTNSKAISTYAGADQPDLKFATESLKQRMIEGGIKSPGASIFSLGDDVEPFLKAEIEAMNSQVSKTNRDKKSAVRQISDEQARRTYAKYESLVKYRQLYNNYRKAVAKEQAAAELKAQSAMPREIVEVQNWIVTPEEAAAFGGQPIPKPATEAPEAPSNVSDFDAYRRNKSGTGFV